MQSNKLLKYSNVSKVIRRLCSSHISDKTKLAYTIEKTRLLFDDKITTNDVIILVDNKLYKDFLSYLNQMFLLYRNVSLEKKRIEKFILDKYKEALSSATSEGWANTEEAKAKVEEEKKES